MFTLPEVIWDREKKEKGRVTGSTMVCRLEGCLGRRIRVVWEDGRSTWPCSKGLRELSETEWQIE